MTQAVRGVSPGWMGTGRGVKQDLFLLFLLKAPIVNHPKVQFWYLPGLSPSNSPRCHDQQSPPKFCPGSFSALPLLHFCPSSFLSPSPSLGVQCNPWCRLQNTECRISIKLMPLMPLMAKLWQALRKSQTKGKKHKLPTETELRLGWERLP